MIYSIVPFHEVAAEVARRIPEFYKGMNETYDKPDVDWEYYLEASHAGQCFAVIATEGRIVGIAVYFVTNNAHHKATIEANNSLLYVEPAYRASVGINLIRKSGELLKAMGVHEINFLNKDKRIAKILSRLGYEPEYTSWSLKNG